MTIKKAAPPKRKPNFIAAPVKPNKVKRTFKAVDAAARQQAASRARKDKPKP